MKTDAPPKLRGAPFSKKRHAGPRVILFGLALVILITAFVVIRVVQTSGPAPDPNSIPERPAAGR